MQHHNLVGIFSYQNCRYVSICLAGQILERQIRKVRYMVRAVQEAAPDENMRRGNKEGENWDFDFYTERGDLRLTLYIT